jgi:uncharacterized protein YbjQ (UPF0145 family)
MIITNIDTVPGRKISKILGIVRGNVVGSKPVSESFFQGLKEAMLSAVALAPRIITGEEVGLVPKEEMRQKDKGEEKETPAVSGNDLEDYSCLLTRLRDTALTRMIANAREREADAVIKVTFDVSVISPRVVEVCSYGTAVKLD